ncbi:MAG TPA: hypothetical protein VLX91_15440 [Candidatus Acidoferrales bacterium]|nr:hypothetical protein [Candidatus Acidoferrales bacterium]
MFYGHVVDSFGDPIGAVGIHYVFDTEPVPLFEKIGRTCPSDSIPYQLPGYRFHHVTMTLYRWYTGEFMGKIFEDTTGTAPILIDWDSLKITNGIYVIHFVGDTMVLDIRIELCDVDYGSLVKKTPLAITDESGNFFLPHGIFGFGIPFTKYDVNNTADTVYVSTKIEFVLRTPGGHTFQKTVQIDTTRNTYQEFHLAE